jgi:uncharacterized membrane protein YfcA
MVIGTMALNAVNERLLVMALAFTIFAYISLRLARPNLVLREAAAMRAAAPVGLAAGILQGATGISSPVLVTFVHSMRLNYRSHVFALSALFFTLTGLQVVALSVTGILRVEWVGEGIFALLPVAVAMPLGQRVGARMNGATFDRMILAFLAVIGAVLLVDW